MLKKVKIDAAKIEGALLRCGCPKCGKPISASNFRYENGFALEDEECTSCDWSATYGLPLTVDKDGFLWRND